VFSAPPKPAGTGNGSLAMTADPNGVRVELILRRADFRIPTIMGGVARGIDHVAAFARDLERAELFYGTGLGLPELPERRKYSPQTESSAVCFGFGKDIVELLHGPAHEDDGSLLRHVALRVDDLDVASEALGVRGVQVTPVQAPPGRGRVAVVRDPDGVLIELLEATRLA
jgi:catechol 2,3-dioxygenase-like lactoylglutathione lyase family enzyme